MKTVLIIVLIGLFLTFAISAEAVQTLTIEEVKEKLFDLEGTVFKIEFKERRNIEQVAKGQYETTLWLGTDFIDAYLVRQALRI